MKFKQGDKVKVKENSKCAEGSYAGKEGVIKKVIRSLPHPYKVDFEKSLVGFFHANELEKVEEV